MTNAFLIGSKVYLRPMEREDAFTIQPWVNDPDVRQFGTMFAPMTLRAEEQFIDKMAQSSSDVVCVIVRQDVDQPIGMTGLHQIDYRNGNCLFGIIIGDKTAWGMGFGTDATKIMVGYAFHTLNMHRVSLCVFDFNKRAIPIYEKVGFQKEGIRREGHYVNGEYCDEIQMGILRREWEEQEER